MVRERTLALGLVTIAGLGLGLGACGGDGNAAAAPVELIASSGGTVLYTWATPTGGFASSPDLAAVPDDARGWVMVEDLASPPPDPARVLVADLGGVTAGAKVTARLMDRGAFEAGAAAAARATAPPVVPGSPADPAAAAVVPGAAAGVIMYSASWCGVCASARKFFAAKGVLFVEKDVERDTGARDELLGKTRAAGMAYKGGVPVLDIGGRLLMGFDARAVENALRAAGMIRG